MFFQSLLCALLLSISLWADELGIDGIERNGFESRSSLTKEDPTLEAKLKKLFDLRGNDFFKPESKADSLIFLRLSNTFISKQLAREREGEIQGYIQAVRSGLESRAKFTAYSVDGKRKYTMSYGQLEGCQGSLQQSMLTGFIYENNRFPLFYPTMLNAYENDEVAVRYLADGEVEFFFPQGEISGYILLSEIDGRRTPVIVSANNLDLKVQDWIAEALDSAFFKFFVFDHQRQILTTTEITTFQLSLSEMVHTLNQIRNAVFRTYRTGRENWWLQESGTYIDYDKQFRDADDYRYKEALKAKILDVDTSLRANNTRKHVALIFGRKRVKDAYLESVHEMAYALGRVSSTGWQQMIQDDQPESAVLEPFVRARGGIKKLVHSVAQEEPLHEKRLESHLQKSGAVTMGYLDYTETTSFDGFTQ